MHQIVFKERARDYNEGRILSCVIFAMFETEVPGLSHNTKVTRGEDKAKSTLLIYTDDLLALSPVKGWDIL